MEGREGACKEAGVGASCRGEAPDGGTNPEAMLYPPPARSQAGGRPPFLPAKGLPQLQHFRSTLCPWGPQACRARGQGRRVQLPEEACGRNKAGGGCEGGGVLRRKQALPPHQQAVSPGSTEASRPCAWSQVLSRAGESLSGVLKGSQAQNGVLGPPLPRGPTRSGSEARQEEGLAFALHSS